MPESAIQTTKLAGTIAPVDMSVMGLIGQSDMVVKAVMLMLLLASLWSWAIIFNKFITLRGLRSKTRQFEKIFWSGQLLDQLYDRVKDHANHPMSLIFVAAMREWQQQNGDVPKSKESTLRAGIKDRIFQSMTVARNRALEPIERHLSFLATVGSAAPFIGLFGTVWGIVNSFQSIAMMKNTSLVVVAPGIAEALLATAIGLFAAIPAVIFYNMFTNDLNRLVNKLDDFSSELGALLSRELDNS